MYVGSLEVKLFLPSVSSLKEKRKIIQSIKTQLKNKLNISISEENNNNLWQMTTLGISCITDSHNNTKNILQLVLEFILRYGEVEVIEKEINIY